MNIEATAEMPKSMIIGDFFGLLAKFVHEQYPEVFSVHDRKGAPPDVMEKKTFFANVVSFFCKYAENHGDDPGYKDVILSGFMVEFKEFLAQPCFENNVLVSAFLFVADQVETAYRKGTNECSIKDVFVSSDVQPDDVLPWTEKALSEGVPLTLMRLSVEEGRALTAENFLSELKERFSCQISYFNEAVHYVYISWWQKTGRWSLADTPASLAVNILYLYFSRETVPDCALRRQALLFIGGYCYQNGISLPGRNCGRRAV